MDMLNWLRDLLGLGGERSPHGPTRFQQKILINAPAEDLYPLADWSDARHVYSQLGHRIVREGEDQYVLSLRDFPGTRFEVGVREADPPSLICYQSTTLPMIGRLIQSLETYRFEAAEDNQTQVTLTVDATFVPDLPPRKWRFEQHKMVISVHNALHKMKLMVEEGPRAVEIASRRLVV